MSDIPDNEFLLRSRQTEQETVFLMDSMLRKARELAEVHFEKPSDDVIATLAVGLAKTHEIAEIGSILDWQLDRIDNTISYK